MGCKSPVEEPEMRIHGEHGNHRKPPREVNCARVTDRGEELEQKGKRPVKPGEANRSHAKMDGVERSQTDARRAPRSGKRGTSAVKPACRVVWGERVQTPLLPDYGRAFRCRMNAGSGQCF